MMLLDNHRIIDLAAGLFPDDLAVVQARAAELLAEEERSLAELHSGPELLYRLEHTAALYLAIGTGLLRRLDEREAEAAPVVDASSGFARRLAPMRQRYNYVRVIARAGSDHIGRARYRCRCGRCGEYFVACGQDIRMRKTKSCGCLRGAQRREAARVSRRAA